MLSDAVSTASGATSQDAHFSPNHHLDINEFLELKEVVTDILPKVTADNFGFVEFNEDDVKSSESKAAMLSWLSDFL